MSASTVTFEDFLQQNGVSRLWKGEGDSTQSSQGALPLGILLPGPASNSPSTQQNREKFVAHFEKILASLKQAKRHLVLSRSSSLQADQVQEVLHQAQLSWEESCQTLKKIKSLSLRLGPQERRRLRALEGMPEWRKVRRALESQDKTQAA
ncbi:MAG: hypothetical protein R3257_01390 [bacterium]|nr:hypothetical protein [bacterium]